MHTDDDTEAAGAASGEPSPAPLVVRDTRWHNVYRQLHHVWNVACGKSQGDRSDLEAITNHIVRMLQWSAPAPTIEVAYASCGNIERRSYTIEQAAARIAELEEHCERVGLELATKTTAPTMTTPETTGEPFWLSVLRDCATNPFYADQQITPIANDGTFKAVADYIDALTARVREVEGRRAELNPQDVQDVRAEFTDELRDYFGEVHEEFNAHRAVEEIVQLRAQLAAATERITAMLEAVRALRAPSLANDGTNGEYVAGHRNGYVEACEDARAALAAAAPTEVRDA